MRDRVSKNGEQTAAGFSAIHRKDVRPKVKYAAIYRHREECPGAAVCQLFEVSRSGYYDVVKWMGRPDAELAEEIRGCQGRADRTYVLESMAAFPHKGSFALPTQIGAVQAPGRALAEEREFRRGAAAGEGRYGREGALYREGLSALGEGKKAEARASAF